VLRSSSPVSAKAEKKAKAQMKFNSKGDGGRGVEEVLESSLHASKEAISFTPCDLSCHYLGPSHMVSTTAHKEMPSEGK